MTRETVSFGGGGATTRPEMKNPGDDATSSGTSAVKLQLNSSTHHLCFASKLSTEQTLSPVAYLKTFAMMKTSAFLLLILPFAEGFSAIQPHVRQSSSSALYAKKSSAKGSKGFAKKAEPAMAAPEPTQQASTGVPSESTLGFSSIEDASASSYSRPQMEVDPNLPTDKRTKEILSKQYGLRSYEEQQGNIREAERAAETQKRMQKIKVMEDDEFDIFMVIPPPIIKGVDAFLKVGLSVTTLLFVLAGLGICAEAWAVATKNTLPENIDTFIVSVIEPNFTYGLLVLLGFSISLGIFATAQLGSGSSMYKEEP